MTDPTRPRPGRRPVAMLAVAALATVAVAPVRAASQPEPQQDRQARRLKQLEVFEELLTRTVQERVSASVNDTIDAARRGDPNGDGVAEEVAAEPLVVKVGQPLAAHGLYIDGYGVIFSIQTPQVSVIPQSFERVLAAPRVLFRGRGPGDAPAADSAQVIELRAEMIDRSLDDLIVLLQEQQDGLHTVRVQELEGVKAVLEELSRASTTEGAATETEGTDTARRDRSAAEAESEAAAEAARRAQEVAAGGAAGRALDRARGLGRASRWEVYYRDALARREDMKAVLERNHLQVADAMNEAALETLASYGSVIKGLDDDERLTVIVLPPNTWTFANGLGVGLDQGEHVVSARSKDIRELDAGKIDYAEFVKRAQVRDRLGLEMVHER